MTLSAVLNKTLHVCRKMLLLAGMIGVAACSTPDNSDPPAELTEIPDAEPVQLLWMIDSGEGVRKNIFNMQPLLVDDKIYTIDTLGTIRKVDAKWGHIDWEYETGLASISGLAGNAQSLIAASKEGVVARFDITLEGLEPRWQKRLQSEIRTRAVMHDELVAIRTVDGKLSALDFNDGTILWSVSRRVPPLSLTGNSHPVVHGDLLISGFDNGKLVAFERKDGSSVWEATVGNPSGRTEIERLVDLDGQFILRDGVIYVSSFQGSLAAVSANSGQVVWSRDFSSFQAMDADDDALYLTDDKSHLWSIDRRTGSAFWKQEALQARKLTAPRLIDGKLVVADLEGYVHFLSKLDGSLLARIGTNERRYISQPLVYGSSVIVLDSTGQLTALSLQK